MEQALAHQPGFGEAVEIGLMQVGQQVLHVQRLHVLAHQMLHVVENEALAGEGGMGFANHHARGVFVQLFDEHAQRRVGFHLRQNHPRRQSLGEHRAGIFLQRGGRCEEGVAHLHQMAFNEEVIGVQASVAEVGQIVEHGLHVRRQLIAAVDQRLLNGIERVVVAPSGSVGAGPVAGRTPFEAVITDIRISAASAMGHDGAAVGVHAPFYGRTSFEKAVQRVVQRRGRRADGGRCASRVSDIRVADLHLEVRTRGGAADDRIAVRCNQHGAAHRNVFDAQAQHALQLVDARLLLPGVGDPVIEQGNPASGRLGIGVAADHFVAEISGHFLRRQGVAKRLCYFVVGKVITDRRAERAHFDAVAMGRFDQVVIVVLVAAVFQRAVVHRVQMVLEHVRAAARPGA